MDKVLNLEVSHPQEGLKHDIQRTLDGQPSKISLAGDKLKGLLWRCSLCIIAGLMLMKLKLSYNTGGSALDQTVVALGLEYPSLSLDISHLFNNIAAGPGADFDPHSHGAFAAEHLPTDQLLHDGIKFSLPRNWSDGAPDNVVTHGEVVALDGKSSFVREFHVLYAGDWIDGESGSTFVFHFADGSKDEIEMSAKNWYKLAFPDSISLIQFRRWTLHWLNQGVIRTPYHYEGQNGDRNHNLTQIYHWSAGVRSDSPLTAITLPDSQWPNHFHLFSLSVVPCGRLFRRPTISIRRIVPTTKWRIIAGMKAYAWEVTATNSLPSEYTYDSQYWLQGPYQITVFGHDVETVEPGVVYRIMPSDEIKTKVWVYYNVTTAISSPVVIIGAHDSTGNTVHTSSHIVPSALTMEPATHDTPEWWDDAKFGIFIHWGLYSVPAWAPKGWYAAWYYWWMHKWPEPNNGFWTYHKEHYGTDITYDDFIDVFNPADFNASAWINFFGDSGAKYFVLVTKHHDGFALFDTKSSTHRSSWHLGPKRDYIRELFDAAKQERPDMKRGTYYSLPEWYNPDVGLGGYGFGSWPGQLAKNAYNESELEPYTGRLPGKDYLRDIQLEHMKMLAHDYETEIMWCDIGGPNRTKEFAEDWFPFAESQGRQVVMNNRCGDMPQFDTPEYARFSSIQTEKWETSEGIDPYCYAYNHATKEHEYKSAQTILHSLIDIVSKNGNYLIGLGPTGSGIFPKPVVDQMLEVGRWLEHSGECIYGTTYFFLGAEDGTTRFTRTADTFCIIALSRPSGGTMVVDRSVPVLKGDNIRLLGGGEEGEYLQWHVDGPSLVIHIPDVALERVQWAWAFQVTYQ